MIRYAVGISNKDPVDEVVRTVQLAEELGYEQVWFSEEHLGRDPYVTMAYCALYTRRVKLSVGVTNPYTRHVALTAAQMASVDEVARGRAVLGIGAGGSNPGLLGIPREKPVLAVREAVEVFRRLLAGETLDYKGNTVCLRNARLGVRPYRSQIPVYIAGRGPAVLELAGEIGDGVIVGGFASEPGFRYALHHVRKGAEKAGRNLDRIDVVAWLYACIDEDRCAAREAVSPLVVVSIINSRATLNEIGIELPPALRRELDTNGWSQAPELLPRYVRFLSDDLIDKFSVAGAAEECAGKVRALLTAGAKQLAILPCSPPGKSKAETMRRFVEEVIPALT